MPPVMWIRPPVAPSEVDVKKRVCETVADNALCFVLLFGLADKHDGKAALAHDGADVSVVDVDQGRFGDGLGDAFDGFCDDLVHHREGLAEREVRAGGSGRSS